MRRTLRCLAIALLPLFYSAPAQVQPAAGLADAAWLAGCWERRDAETGSGEMWSAPAGGSMLGVSRTVRDGRTVEFEFMRIHETAPGRIAFVALPSGQTETSFTLVASRPGELVFENAAHDFPQRVIYRALPPDGLLARIEGMRNGRPAAFDFPMSRTACPAGAP